MAIYHCTTKPLSRSAGRSAVAAAAYRSGQSLTDDRTGMVHDYTKKTGVMESYTVLPSGETCDRSKLWNTAELAEKRKDSRTAREWIIAIPSELVPTENHRELISGSPDYDLVGDFAKHLSKTYDVAVDVAIHAPDKKGDQKNYHAHILTTTRTATIEDGELVLGGKATIELSDKKRGELGLCKAKDEVKNIRETWENLANQALEKQNINARIDHRSLKDQGIDRIPQIHVGVTATSMDRKGKLAERAARNDEIKKLNAEVINFQKARDRLRPKVEIVKAIADQSDPTRKADKVFDLLLDQAHKNIDIYVKQLEQEKNKKYTAWSAHMGEKPEQPRGLFSAFKRKQFESDKAQWSAEEKALRSQRIDAEKKWDGKYKQDAYTQAISELKKKHPDLHFARENRIKKESDNRIKERRKKRIESRDQDDGMGL